MSKAPAIRPPTVIAKSAFLFPNCIISVVRRRPLYWHAIGQEAQKPGQRHRRENQKSAVRCPKSDRFLMHHKRLTIESDVRDQRSENRHQGSDNSRSLFVIGYWISDPYAKRSRAVLQLPAPFFKNTRARLRYSYGAASWVV